jgi:Holliday junction resolvase-like predicted endonuclease
LLQSESGLAFENDIREFLEGKGYKVVSNILFSFYGKHFEVDHLIFKDGNMYIVSCKDRSSFQYLPNLYSKIRFAIGEIDFRRKTINCDKSQIYVKVKKGFLSKLKNVFQEYQTDKLSLMVTD